MNTSRVALTGSARSDEDLATGFGRGEQVCFEELVRRYSGPIYAFVLRMVGRPEDADDLTQDVFVQLLKSLPGARADLPLRPWIFVIARNKCLDHLKRRRAIPFSVVAHDEDEHDLDLADGGPLPEELVERADLQQLLAAAVAELPDRYRSVVALRSSTDLTFAEIGAVLGLPENTVKTHFQRAKGLLRRRLSDYR